VGRRDGPKPKLRMCSVGPLPLHHITYITLHYMEHFWTIPLRFHRSLLRHVCVSVSDEATFRLRLRCADVCTTEAVQKLPQYFQGPLSGCGIRTARELMSEKGEVLLRGVLTLRFVSHAQPARLWKTCFNRYFAHGLAIHPKSGS